MKTQTISVAIAFTDDGALPVTHRQLVQMFDKVLPGSASFRMTHNEVVLEELKPDGTKKVTIDL